MLKEEVCGVGSTFPVSTNKKKKGYYIHNILYIYRVALEESMRERERGMRLAIRKIYIKPSNVDFITCRFAEPPRHVCRAQESIGFSRNAAIQPNRISSIITYTHRARIHMHNTSIYTCVDAYLYRYLHT